MVAANGSSGNSSDGEAVTEATKQNFQKEP